MVCCDFIVSAIVGRLNDGTVIDVVLVRGAIFTCFFGNTLAYVFFMAFDLREMGDTLAILRSTTFLPLVPFVMAVVVIVVVADDDGNVSVLVAVVVVPFVDGIVDGGGVCVVTFASTNIRESSFCDSNGCCCCCCCEFGTKPVDRTTILVKSLRRLGNVFICVLKNPVILVCDRIFGALPLLTLIPEVMVAEDLNPLLFGPLVRFESFRSVFAVSVSHSAVTLFTVAFDPTVLQKVQKKYA